MSELKNREREERTLQVWASSDLEVMFDVLQSGVTLISSFLEMLKRMDWDWELHSNKSISGRKMCQKHKLSPEHSDSKWVSRWLIVNISPLPPDWSWESSILEHCTIKAKRWVLIFEIDVFVDYSANRPHNSQYDLISLQLENSFERFAYLP